MKRILLALTKVAFDPEETQEYHPILGFEPAEPYLDATAVLLLYAAALVPFWIGAAFVGLRLEEVLVLSMLIWAIGLALGGVHPTAGLLAILSLGILAVFNDSLREVGLWVPYEAWRLALMFVYLPLSFTLQALARSRGKGVYRWLQVVLTLAVGLLGGVVAWRAGWLDGARLWTGVALGALSLVGSSEIGEDEPLSIVGAIVAVVAGFGMSWHLYALIFPPDDWTTWLRVVQGLFSVLATIAMALTAGVILGLAEEQDQAFDYSWQLMFFLYAAFAWADRLPYVLLAAFVVVVWTWLAFPTWSAMRKGTPVAGRMAGVLVCAAICAFATFALFSFSDHRLALRRLFLPDYALRLHPYSLFIAVGIVFTASAVSWPTVVAAVATTIGPLLAGSLPLPALGIAAGLAALAAFLGYTHILLWPFLSLLTLGLRRRVRRASGPDAEACLLATRTTPLYRDLPGSLGTDALLAALARKGVPAETFARDDFQILNRYWAIQIRQYAAAVGAAASLEEALEIDTAPPANERLEQALRGLREAQRMVGEIPRVRAFAAAIKDLTAAAEESRKEQQFKLSESLPVEGEHPVEGDAWTAEAQVGDRSTGEVDQASDARSPEGDDTLPAEDATTAEADLADRGETMIPPDDETVWTETDGSDDLEELYWPDVASREAFVQALDSLRRLAYDEIRPAVETYWETYSAFPAAVWDTSSASSEFLDRGVGEGGWAGRGEIQTAIERCLSRIKKISERLSTIRPYRDRLPAEERDYLRKLEDVSRRLTSMPREMDYQARSRLTEENAYMVSKMREDLPATWLTIALDEDNVVEQRNPWSAYAEALDGQVSCLAELNEQMFIWVTAQLLDALEQTREVGDFASLRENLHELSGFGERYGPVIDITIESLESVGRDIGAALAFPRGYNRRLGLQDALAKVNKLRASLETRYLQEMEPLRGSLARVAQVLHAQAFPVSESEPDVYRNPYIAGNPINLERATLFKGRLDLAQEIVALLRHRGNPTVVLYGPRRMGKTSFLLQLPRLLPSDYLPVFLDMQQGGAQQSDGSFTYALAHAIWRQLRRETTLQRPDLDEHEKHPYTAMDTWLDDVQPLVGERIVFFTIDEFEAIGKAIERGALTIQVLEHLRSLMQHRGNLLLMFAGVQTIDALGPDPASYFISAHPVEISYLHPRQAEELIRNPDPQAGRMPDYDDAVVADILHLTHCQPYLIQAICSEIVEMANVKQLTRIEQETLHKAADRVLTTSLLFQNIWDDAGEEGQEILRRLAAGPQPLDDTEFGEELLDALLRRHVISEVPGAYEIEIPMVRDWIRREVG